MPHNYKSIVVGIDGSVEADQAFEKGVAIAQRNNATLTIVHIVDTRSYQGFESFDGNVPEETRNEIRETLEEYKNLALKRGVTSVTSLLEYGSPKRNLARTIPESVGADLIVLGATGLNAIERVFIGSVSEYVVRNAVCDVLIIRKHEKQNKWFFIEKVPWPKPTRQWWRNFF